MQCRTAKPKAKPFKLFDADGLYLYIMPSGAKYWRLKYRLFDKEKLLSFGVYPKISLLDARNNRMEAKQKISQGIDPTLDRLERKQLAAFAQAQTFEIMALEWHEQQTGHWSMRHADTVRYRLDKYVFPEIGTYPLQAIKPVIMLACLKKIDKTAPEMSRRMKRICSHIFKYAIATGRTETDPTYGLECALRKYKRGHYASITVDEFPDFLLKLHNYKTQVYRQTYLAIQLMMLTFVRTQEMVEAKWTEIDFEKAMWIIPGERMKMGLTHMVPLSRQSIEILKELKEMNGHRTFVFPSLPRPRNPMSKNTILQAVKRMGYAGKMTGHGFRSLALGLLKEKLGYTHEVADRQLAHVPKSSVDRAYDRAQFLPQRTAMMQVYADYIDKIYLQELEKKSMYRELSVPSTG